MRDYLSTFLTEPPASPEPPGAFGTFGTALPARERAVPEPFGTSGTPPRTRSRPSTPPFDPFGTAPVSCFEPPAEPWGGPGTAAPGEPRGWRTGRAFVAYMRDIGAEMFDDGDRLVCVARRSLFSRYVATALRIYRDDVARIARPGPSRLERHDEGWFGF